MSSKDPDDPRDSRSLLPDSIRRALLSGMSAVFMTEEGIRSVLGDMRLPKEAMAYLLQQTDRQRRELLRLLSQEVKGFLKGVDLNREARRVLNGMRLQIRADIKFVDDDVPKTRVKARVKRARATQDEPTPRKKRPR